MRKTLIAMAALRHGVVRDRRGCPPDATRRFRAPPSAPAPALLVAGPVGAVAGGVIGATVGGPTGRPHRRCWTEWNGVRRCKTYSW